VWREGGLGVGGFGGWSCLGGLGGMGSGMGGRVERLVGVGGAFAKPASSTFIYELYSELSAPVTYWACPVLGQYQAGADG